MATHRATPELRFITRNVGSAHSVSTLRILQQLFVAQDGTGKPEWRDVPVAEESESEKVPGAPQLTARRLSLSEAQATMGRATPPLAQEARDVAEAGGVPGGEFGTDAPGSKL